MKIFTVVGARPQFIKAWPVTKALREKGVAQVLLHTGQHYDHRMSDVFFEELEIPRPNINLNVGSGTHAAQTAKMLEGIEHALNAETPDIVLLYGDTNSTLAGALAAVKMHIPVAHVEAGLRSFNRKMPEEHNRIITDHCSDMLFCPTETAVLNLGKEGICDNVFLVGDVMRDAVVEAAPLAKQACSILTEMQLLSGRYALATIHRPENVDNQVRLQSILKGLGSLGVPVALPLHPRTSAKLKNIGPIPENVKLLRPLSYIEMVRLTMDSCAVLTDSGGLQKEAVWLGRPCITLRDETEWVETVNSDRNRLAGADPQQIKSTFDWAMECQIAPAVSEHTSTSSKKIVELMLSWFAARGSGG